MFNNAWVQATVSSGTTVNFVATGTGDSTNYSLSVSCTSGNVHFNGCSFTPIPSGSALAGGRDAQYSYDSAAVYASINGFLNQSQPFDQNSSPTSVATQLAADIHNRNPSVDASASGKVVTLYSRSGGAYTNYPFSAYSSSAYSPQSFPPSASGARMSGGTGGLYNVNLAYFNNSDVQSANDSINGSWAYTYDDFNRLSTAVATNVNQGCVESYDRYGNRWSQQPGGGTGLSCSGFAASFSGNNNRMDTYSYDAAGNLLSDGTYTFTYDAENRIVAVNGGSVANYVYNAEGQRVRKTSSAGTVDYLHDLSGHTITELSSAGAWNRGEVYAGGTHLATYANGAGGSTYFSHSDWLGNERVRSDVAGGFYSSWTSLPFGEGSSVPNPGPTHFTGKERDSESGLDNFGARYNASTMGRFMSPDPDQESGFMHMNDPQSWNGYAYARNNPLIFSDPNGENYRVCDANGKNCGDIDDKTFENEKAQDQKNGELFQNGQMFHFDGDGNRINDGTYRQTDVDLPGDPAANRAAAGAIVATFDQGMKEFGKNAAIAVVTAGVGQLVGAGIEAYQAGRAANAVAGTGTKAAFTAHAAVRAAERGISQAMVDEAITTAEQTGAISSRVGQYGTIQNTYHGTNGISVVVETEGANAGRAITVYRTGSK